MEDDLAAYAAGLRTCAARMEKLALTIRHKQREHARKEQVITRSFHQELTELQGELHYLDKDLHTLAVDAKRFIKMFQGLGMQSQLSVLQDRVDMLKVDQWINRNEFERIIKKSEN